MTVDRVRAILASHADVLSALGVCRLSVFGSVARGEAGPESDVDLLVEFDQPRGLLTLARLQRELSDWLGAPVDLAEPEGLRGPVREQVLKEAVRAA